MASVDFIMTANQRGRVTFQSRPLERTERRIAHSGRGQIGAGATIYLNLIAARHCPQATLGVQ
jgi:hypothetical protein